MRKRRTFSEIITSYLKKGKDGWVTKTSLMHKLGHSFDQNNRYLEALEKAGFIDKRNNPDFRKKDDEQVYPLELGNGEEKFDKTIKTIYRTNQNGLELLKDLSKLEGKLKKVKEFF